MKVSSLNKFKGKKVVVVWLDKVEREYQSEGILDDVSEDTITISTETSLQNIGIREIERLELAE